MLKLIYTYIYIYTLKFISAVAYFPLFNLLKEVLRIIHYFEPREIRQFLVFEAISRKPLLDLIGKIQEHKILR